MRRPSADEDCEVLVRELWESHLLELDPQVAATKRWRSGYWKKWYENVLFTCDDDESDQDRRQVTEEAQLAETHPSEEKAPGHGIIDTGYEIPLGPPGGFDYSMDDDGRPDNVQEAPGQGGS